jgi:hypothetical protein
MAGAVSFVSGGRWMEFGIVCHWMWTCLIVDLFIETELTCRHHFKSVLPFFRLLTIKYPLRSRLEVSIKTHS